MTAILEKTSIKKVGILILYVVIAVLSTKLLKEIYTYSSAYKEEKKNTICPPLLSIGRSARDTLIVMKAEPLCNIYVLDNLR